MKIRHFLTSDHQAFTDFLNSGMSLGLTIMTNSWLLILATYEVVLLNPVRYPKVITKITTYLTGMEPGVVFRVLAKSSHEL